ncbi:MAG TPA: zinc ABC transporter substrate-binding protein, partial [Solirubrobacteraceae bacterium]|nr:zinc ABC transporter substrate-binding protein [Solirubrobacteraceae bacterium]
LVTSRLRAWQLWSIVLAAAEGVAGLWLSYVTDAPPGATIAVLGGAVFALVAWAQSAGARTRVALAVAAAAGLAAAGFAMGPETSTDRPQVVATTTQLGDVARAIAGHAAHVTQLLQPAADPHEYEPRPSDVRAVSSADLILASGRHLDDWIGDVAGEAGAGGEVVRIGDAVPDRVRTDEGLDPHWWHDARNMAAAARMIGDRLAPEVGADAPAVRRRAAAYARRAERLDAAITRCMARVPRDRRKLVTDHDAFATFAARYDLQVVGAVIPSRTTQAQPSAGDVARLTRLIRREHVRAVFPERAVDPRLARALAEQAGARVGGQLYADALGPRGSRGATWPAAEAANADAVVLGLTGGTRRCRIAHP